MKLCTKLYNLKRTNDVSYVSLKVSNACELPSLMLQFIVGYLYVVGRFVSH